nr:RHS repeat-associated core domain-containing protein [Duganella qianjiadongensis]
MASQTGGGKPSKDTKYVYLNRHLLAEIELAGATSVSYNHTDALGSPIAKTNAIGVRTALTKYEPYGLTLTGSTTPTIGFTGHVNDADTGLTYMQQRYYDPVAGRFLSIDPVVTDMKTGGGFNRYIYANNSPYNYIDPDGRASEVTWNSAGTVVNIKIPFAISDPAGVARFTSSQVATEVGNRLSGNVVIGGVAVKVTTVGVPVPLNSPSVVNGSANVITVRPALGRSLTNEIGGNKISLRGTADAKVVTHELAHSAKAGDQYPGGVDAAGKVIPVTATQTTNNIMGDVTGAANAQTLREMAGPRPPPSSMVSKDF